MVRGLRDQPGPARLAAVHRRRHLCLHVAQCGTGLRCEERQAAVDVQPQHSRRAAALQRRAREPRHRGLERQDHHGHAGCPPGRASTRRPARKSGPPTRFPTASASGEMGKHYSITMAPRVAKGKVFIGASGGEYGVRGWIAAFDAETGKEVWRFWTVSGRSRPRDSRPRRWRRPRKPGAVSGGRSPAAAARCGMRPSTIRSPTCSTSAPAMLRPGMTNTREPTLGDDLYTASIIAVKPDTGEYVWHYQETPGDSWDYDAVSPMMTADLVIGWTQAARHHAALEERLLLRARGQDRQAAERRSLHRSELGDGRGPEDRPPASSTGGALRKAPWDLAPGVQGGHSWHPECLQPGYRPGLHPRLGGLLHDGRSPAGQRSDARPVQSRHQHGRASRSEQTAALRALAA